MRQINKPKIRKACEGLFICQGVFASLGASPEEAYNNWAKNHAAIEDHMANGYKAVQPPKKSTARRLISFFRK